jgi:hypothetical protein
MRLACRLGGLLAGLLALSLVGLSLVGPTSARAEPTEVVIRARALDAKFIGSHVGGVQVTLTNAETGAELEHGRIEGGTGDTKRLMTQAQARGDALADADTAKYTAHLDLSEPTRVKVQAIGPGGMEVSAMMWVLPGRNVDGDGWVLNFPGLIVSPTTVQAADRRLQIRATVSLMCGCPIEPGGLWDAARYQVVAELRQSGAQPIRFPLAYAGEKSKFAGEPQTSPPPGAYSLRVTAVDAKSPNAGVAMAQVVIK